MWLWTNVCNTVAAIAIMPPPRMMLVVTGDDFGYCPRRNQGIVDCFQAGGISNVSLLVNACATKEAAHLAKRYNIPVGLHANLSEGIPVCLSLQRASTLVNEHGFFLGKMGFRHALERGQLSMKQAWRATSPRITILVPPWCYLDRVPSGVNYQQGSVGVAVELELKAQVTLFVELTGHLPHHMDGHQHIHVLPGGQMYIWDLPPWAKTCLFRGCKWPSVTPWLHLLQLIPAAVQGTSLWSQQSSWFILVILAIPRKEAVERALMTFPSQLTDSMS
ncbi:carbohydrate deacetylase isoform X4 [Mugil cephalus]|uniref:carbohydrate deacetylase isoform X4 n=1 Tax=Mugil cephalus TaxID=48193 RepID=UPI001FB64C52|nr:carbohydrate deacetylase isoform X4 [Mugil cephalus]